MSVVDRKTVEMVFDNFKFEKNIQTSILSLEKLKESLGTGLDKAASAAEKSISGINTVSLNAIQSSISALESRFSTFGLVGWQVINRLTDSAINLASKLKGITFDKIFEGGKNRAMKLENANFMMMGLLEDEKEVAAIMEDVDKSVSGTAYGLDAAASAAAQFAATGMRAGDGMYKALRGIAGAAAMTNSQYEDISRIFTTVSGNGRLMGDQLLQFSSRGLNVASTLTQFFNDVNDGTKDASEETTNYIKELTNGLPIAEQDLREFVSKGEINFAIFSEAMDSAFGEHAKKANETLTGVIANMGSALSRIGATFYTPLIKQNGPLVKFFQQVREQIVSFKAFTDPIMSTMAERISRTFIILARHTKSLKMPTAEMGEKMARIAEVYYNSIEVYIKGFVKIADGFRNAISEVADSQMFQQLDDITDTMVTLSSTAIKTANSIAFANFVNSERAVENFKNIFVGLLSLLNIGWKVFDAVSIAISPLTNELKKATLAAFDMAGSIGQWLKMISESVTDDLYKWANLTNKSMKEFVSGNKYFLAFKDQIKGIVVGIKDFVNSSKTLNNLKNIFSGLASVVSMIAHTFTAASIAISPFINLFREFALYIFDVFGSLGLSISKFEGTYNSFIMKMGEDTRDFLNKIINGKGLRKFFDDLRTGIEEMGIPTDKFIAKIKGITNAIKEWADNNLHFGDFFSGLQKDAEETGKKLTPLRVILETVKKAISMIWDVFKTILPALGKVGMGIGKTINDLFQAIADAFANEGMKGLAKWVNSGLLVALAKQFYGLIDTVRNASNLITGERTLAQRLGFAGPLRNLAEALNDLTMLIDIKAIGQIAIAILTISFAIMVLSSIDTAKLAVALGGVKALTVILTAAMKEVSDLINTSGTITEIGKAIGQYIAISQVFQKIAIGVVLLALALKILDGMDPKSIGVGVLAITALMVNLVGAVKILNKDTEEIAKGFGSLIFLATSVLLLSVAIKKLGSLDKGVLEKGLAAMTLIIAEMTYIMKVLQTSESTFLWDNGDMSKSKSKNGGFMSMIGLAIALLLIGKEIEKLGSLDNNTLAKGTGSITLIILAMAEFSKLTKDNNNMLKAAAAMIVASLALTVMAGALKIYSSMNLEELCRGLLGVGAMLAAMLLAFKIMDKLNPYLILESSKALALASLGFLEIALALRMVGSMSVGQIIASVLGLAGALAVFGASAYLFDKLNLEVALTKLGRALSAFGLGLVAISGAMLIFAVAMSLFAVSGIAGATALVGSITIILGVIPAILYQLASMGEAFVAVFETLFISIGKALINSIPILKEALVVAIGSVVRALEDVVPELMDLLTMILGEVFLFIEDKGEDFINLAIQIVQWFLEGLSKRMDDITNTAIDIVLTFLGAIADRMDEIALKGFELLCAFIDGIATAIDEKQDDLKESVKHLIKSILKAIGDWATDFLETGSDLINSLLHGILDAAEGLLDSLIDIAAEILKVFLPDDWVDAGANLIKGLIKGIKDFFGAIFDIAKDIFDALIGGIKKLFGIHSPSTVMAEIGGFLMEGLLNGITGFFDAIGSALDNLCELIFMKLNPLSEFSGKVGESIYDALHPDAPGADLDAEADALRQKALIQHQKGVKSSDLQGQEALYVRQLEQAQEAAEKGLEFNTSDYDASVAKYYNSLVTEAKRGYSEVEKVAEASGASSAEAYNASHYTAIEQSKTQNAEAARVSYSETGQVATEAGTTSGNDYNASHYTAIEQSKSQNTEAVKNSYSGVPQVSSSAGSRSGKEFSEGNISGMESKASEVTNAGKSLGTNAASGASSKKGEFKVAGTNYVLGLRDGIDNNSSQGAVMMSLSRLASRMVNQLKKSLDEHSPSKETEEIGKYFVLGLVKGVNDTQSMAYTSVKNVSENILTEMSDGLSNTKDLSKSLLGIQDEMYKVSNMSLPSFNSNPQITPVFSTDGIQNGISRIQDLFDTSNSLSLSHQAVANWGTDDQFGTMMNSINSNNKKVVDAITDIRRDITNLQDSVGKMRIFLDSGTLVGGIVNEVDNALGSIAFMKRRTGGV